MNMDVSTRDFLRSLQTAYPRATNDLGCGGEAYPYYRGRSGEFRRQQLQCLAETSLGDWTLMRIALDAEQGNPSM